MEEKCGEGISYLLSFALPSWVFEFPAFQFGKWFDDYIQQNFCDKVHQ